MILEVKSSCVDLEISNFTTQEITYRLRVFDAFREKHISGLEAKSSHADFELIRGSLNGSNQ